MAILKVLSLFSGIGAFEKALARLNITYQLVGYSEIDKYASTAYSAIHNIDENLNLGDITKIDETKLPDFDLLCFAPPCQSFSVAGKQLGFDDKRGILFFDALRIIKHNKPKYCIMENVKNLTGKKFKNEFNKILNSLNNVGYNNYWKILNAKDYGIPQNRERVFVISIRKDIDDGKFEFPNPLDSKLKLKNLLEDIVDEKYYVSKHAYKRILERLNNKKGLIYNWSNKNSCVTLKAIQIKNNELKIKYDNICSCIDANYGKGLDNHASRTGIIQIGMLDIKGNEQIRRVYDTNGISPTLNTMQGGNRQPKILEEIEYKIRKLTPLECWRLMGFNDKDFYIAKKSLNNTYYKGKDRSDSQLYKQAGNSIVVNVLEKIFIKLF